MLVNTNIFRKEDTIFNLWAKMFETYITNKRGYGKGTLDTIDCLFCSEQDNSSCNKFRICKYARCYNFNINVVIPFLENKEYLQIKSNTIDNHVTINTLSFFDK